MLLRVLTLALLFSTPAFAGTRFGFEGGTLKQWSLKRLPGRANAHVITSPVRAGKFAAAIGLAPGVRYKDGWKNELSDPLLAPFHREIWYRISHYLPLSYAPGSDNKCMLAQWHNASEHGLMPLLSHEYYRGRLHVRVAYGKRADARGDKDIAVKQMFSIPMARGRWHDFVYRAYWPHGKDGYVEAWYNGKYMGIYRGPLGYRNDDAGPYFKTGMYCKKSPAKALTAYVDEYIRGDRREDVLLPGEKLEAAR